MREGGDDASSADRVEDFCVEDEVLFRERWVFLYPIFKTLRAIESGREDVADTDDDDGEEGEVRAKKEQREERLKSGPDIGSRLALSHF